jgi:hypothetical protein
MRKRSLTLFAILAMVAGCATTSAPPPDVAVDGSPALLLEFMPADAQANIQFLEGRHQNLFAPTSSAVWVNDSVAAMKLAKDKSANVTVDPQLEKDAVVITENFVVIECVLESSFPDMSIAYETVGLRGVDAHIELPGGKMIAAIQRVPKLPIEEEQRDALKLFRRTMLLIFPKRDFATGDPYFISALENVKLVLVGNNSTFYFEWPTAIPGTDGNRTMTVKDMARAVKTGFTEVYSAIRPVLHAFD